MSIFYLKEGREFNDEVPFIIFTILMSTIIFIGVATKDIPKLFDTYLKPIIPFYRPVLLVLAVLIIQFMLMLITFAAIPNFFLHLAGIGSPLVQIVSSLFIGRLSIIGLVFIFSALQLAFYFYCCRKRIKLCAFVLKQSTRYLIFQFPSLLLMIFVISKLLLVSIAATLFGLSNQIELEIPTSLVLAFVIYWCFITSINLLSAFTSSVVYLEVLETKTGESSIVTRSLFFVLMSLGSVMLAGIITTIVYIFRCFVIKSNDQHKAVYSRILTVLFLFALNILGDIFEKINAWVFTYMAIYGTSYTNSIRKSYSELINGQNKPIMDNLIVGRLSLIASIFYSLVLFILSGTLAMRFKIIEYNTFYPPELADSPIALPWICIMIIFIWVSLMSVAFESAANSFMFAFNKDEEAVKRNQGDNFDILEQARKII